MITHHAARDRCRRNSQTTRISAPARSAIGENTRLHTCMASTTAGWFTAHTCTASLTTRSNDRSGAQRPATKIASRANGISRTTATAAATTFRRNETVRTTPHGYPLDD